MPQRVVRIKVRKRLLGKYVWKILEREERVESQIFLGKYFLF